jgi:molecular chaperone DnaK (HSP70)
MILAFLKELAEQQTGEKIDQAVVTVPAYFSHIQRQQTDEAGRLAGFREVVTLLEPVAAALAYSLASEAERLRIFVYDLGGGTFDATVLEKDRYGGITVLSFGGDPFLGGDDVDARLARHMIKRLAAQGHRLELNLDAPADYSRFQRFKFYAEVAKKELSKQETVTLTHQGFLEDQDGATIDLDLTLTRAELEECARDLIQRSIEESQKTLAKNEIPLDSIDEVIMVGGMSRMPLAQAMLGEAFRREPRVVDPDLIVARGAAVKAAEVFGEQAVAESGLRLELRYDRATDKSHTTISGLFDRPLHDHTVYLLSPTVELAAPINGGDRFSFDQVPLTSNADNVFTLSVEDTNENPVIERELTITHQPGASGIIVSPGSVVTKPIQIWTSDGQVVLFPENTALPHAASRTFKTGDQSGQIIAPIWEGDSEVARLEIKDIPPDLKIGTPVIIEVSVEADYQIHASATVPDIQRNVAIKFKIDPVDVSHITPDFVRGEMARLDQESVEVLTKCPSAEAAQLFQFHFRQVKNQIEVELSEPEPKRAKLLEKLGELDALIKKLPSEDKSAQLQPTYEEFSERLRQIVDQASESHHPSLAGALPQITALEEKARAAWQQRDAFAWARVQDQLGAIAQMLKPKMDPREEALGWAAFIVKLQLPEIRQAAAGRYSAEIAEIENEAIMAFGLLERGAIDAPEAVNRLIQLYQTRVVPLRQKLGLLSKAEPQVAAGGGLLKS